MDKCKDTKQSQWEFEGSIHKEDKWGLLCRFMSRHSICLQKVSKIFIPVMFMDLTTLGDDDVDKGGNKFY